MALVPGSRLGPYEIIGPLGAGGMGEVYKARDTRLERSVAVKVLPLHLSSSPGARQRLEREARTISKLSHPHICALYDVGHHDGTDFLVMELLEGETLAVRLAKSPLPLEQTMRCGVEIADALDAAHRQGVVHRDLKPGNVMVTKSGVKLLDFGLAKAFAPLFPESDLSGLATNTAPHDLTQEGSVPGTLQYMSPEQIEGRPIDSRSDIFAFGVVLHEMATGRRVFTGKSRAALAAAIVGDEPAAISSLLPTSPPALDRLVRVCLAKDPEQRWQTAHDIGLQLAAMRDSAQQADPSTPPVGRASRRWIPWAVAVAAAAVAVRTLLLPGAASNPAPTPIRFSVPMPPGNRLDLSSMRSVSIALSPDGSRLGFVGRDQAGVTRIWLRPLSALEALPVAGTEGATSFFWSPDGRSIAFFAGGKLKRLDLPGGAAVALCDIPERLGMVGTWGSDGKILFTVSEGAAIFGVAAIGGSPIAEIKPDTSRNERGVLWPWFLPDGKRFLYLARHSDYTGQLMLAEPGKPPRSVLPVASNVQWVDPDYLVFVRDGTLVGQRFDLSSGRLTGGPFSIAEPVNYFFPTGRAIFSTSRNGALLFLAHSDRSRLVWFDRSGREMATVGAPAGYRNMRISPDGRKAAIDRLEAGPDASDLWTIDLDRGIETRLTTEAGGEVAPVWLPDGSAVIYAHSDGAAPRHLFLKELVTGAEKVLLPVGSFQIPEDVSPDGRTVTFMQKGEQGTLDIWTMALSGKPEPAPWIQSAFEEQGARFSPDGRHLAYVSDESGHQEVYVASFPSRGEKTRVSSAGGTAPRWSHDGRELFYLSDDEHLVSAPIRLDRGFELGRPVPLFALNGGTAWLDFDIPPDGKKFLAIVPEIVAEAQPLTVVLNWTAEIRH